VNDLKRPIHYVAKLNMIILMCFSIGWLVANGHETCSFSIFQVPSNHTHKENICMFSDHPSVFPDKSNVFPDPIVRAHLDGIVDEFELRKVDSAKDSVHKISL